MVFGLMGVYAFESEKVGLLGLIGFVLAVVGTSLNAAANVILGALMQPVIAQQAPALLDPTSPFMLSAAKPIKRLNGWNVPICYVIPVSLRLRDIHFYPTCMMIPAGRHFSKRPA